MPEDPNLFTRIARSIGDTYTNLSQGRNYYGQPMFPPGTSATPVFIPGGPVGEAAGAGVLPRAGTAQAEIPVARTVALRAPEMSPSPQVEPSPSSPVNTQAIPVNPSARISSGIEQPEPVGKAGPFQIVHKATGQPLGQSFETLRDAEKAWSNLPGGGYGYTTSVPPELASQMARDYGMESLVGRHIQGFGTITKSRINISPDEPLPWEPSPLPVARQLNQKGTTQ